MTREELYELKNKRAALLTEGNELLSKKDLEGHRAKMAEVDKLNQEISAVEKQLAEEDRFSGKDEAEKDLREKNQQKDEAAQKRVDDIRSSNEYARAFAKAMRMGATVKSGLGVEELQPLYKALTEGGGTPEGADGGFLVPIDVDNRIQKLEKEYLDLSRYFHVEPVTTNTGWRVVEVGHGKALPKVVEMGTFTKDDQPSFRKITYTCEKYGDRIAISSELLEDNAAGLLNYVVDWFGPKYILTKNALLTPYLTGLTSTVTLGAGSEVKDLRKALIKKLNVAQGRGAYLLTNQSGYAEMVNWTDANGRSMLVPNPADPDVYRFQGRTVVYGDDEDLPLESGKAPLYVGKFSRLATLFVRKGIELATTNVGGDAWATGSTELRALCRMGSSLVDTTAAFKALISVGGASTTPSGGAGGSSSGGTNTDDTPKG